MRLSASSLDRLSPAVTRFDYDRDQQQVGIVHLGMGAFHRAHQAWYTDRAMDAGERDWAIVGVSLCSETAARRLNPQDGLYSVTERGVGEKTRVVGSVRRAIAAIDDFARADAAAAIALPSTRIVTLTVTEKGYAPRLGAAGKPQPSDHGIYGLLAEGLARRRRAGLPGVTLLSCDNLSGNGAHLLRSMTAYLAANDPDLLDWFAERCTCPSTMVDRIVPAPTDADRLAVEEALGLEDAAAVVTEPFSEWIIEDRFAAARPRWDAVGAAFVADVAPYETAKLRMLNGAHSALAYLGLERGYRFVDEALADRELGSLVEDLMDEASTSFTAAPGQDLAAYADWLVVRMANPALGHRLEQIATDGSEKIRQRWLATIADRRARRSQSPAILTALGAWVRHVRGMDRQVNDPLAPQLAALWSKEGGAGIASALFGERGMFAGALSEEEQQSLTAILQEREPQKLH